MDRRSVLKAGLAGALAAQEKPGLGIPGPYRGRVVSVTSPNSIVSGSYQAETIKQMMHKGMLELTGAPGWPDAWRIFVQKGDVVGIKVNPVGGRRLCSDPSVLRQIIDGITQAGIPSKDIVVYDRYRRQFLGVGFHRWLPEGVRWTWAAEDYDNVQLGMDGYDPDVYMELPLVKPGQDPRDKHVRRSYLARFLTQEVNKLVNLPVLKHHNCAGVTLALKNLSHGLANNVNRCHVDAALHNSKLFIPSVVEHPVIRGKAVLHILDGVKACYDKGPGGNPQVMWEHKTMYFATDPVAMDRIGWRVIDEKRVQAGMPRVAEVKLDRDNAFICQPEHILVAGTLGLGECDESRIEHHKFEIGGA